MTDGEIDDEIKATLKRMARAGTEPLVAGTIRPRPAEVSPASEGLPRLDRAAAEIVPLRELGRGGMGVVHLAEQRSLGREVATKSPTSNDPATAGALLREARIMGALEHPNLVPIHWLGVDENGLPVLVMKRIEGATWRDLLDHPDHPAWAPLLAGHGDRLRANVEILSQVSRALAFAHDRGVIHRDLKPENVMLGRFGEVYLLDWGVALRLSERSVEPKGTVGTPSYLAPEMVCGDPLVVDARTDVFLLGATLYEVIMGRAPHDAPTLLEALVHALRWRPPRLPPGVPAALARLVVASMATDKDHRPPTAEAFREALTQFLVSRAAALVAADARAALGRAAALIAAEGPASRDAFRFLIEARFGLTTARSSLPDDDAIRADLEASITALVEREIALRSPDTARALLADLAAPPPDLGRRLAALEAETAVERTAAASLAQAKREADTSKMVTPFSWILVGMASFGALAAPIAYHGAVTGRAFPVSEAIAFDVASFVTLVGAFVVARRAFLATPATRRIAGAYGIACVGVLLSDAVTFALGRGTGEAGAHSLLTATIVTGITAATLVRQLWLAVPVLAATVVATLAWPRFSSVFVIVALTTVAIVYTHGFRVHAAGRPAVPGG